MKKIGNEKIFKEIERLKKEISGYPIGSISRKMINGKEKYYHQWYESGKTKSKYLKQDEVEILRKNIELRKIAEKKLNDLELIVQQSGDESGIISAQKGIKQVTGSFDGRYIIPDKDIYLSSGQTILVTIHDAVDKRENIDLDKYINHGKKLFPADAQEYIRGLRNEERI